MNVRHAVRSRGSSGLGGGLRRRANRLGDVAQGARHSAVGAAHEAAHGGGEQIEDHQRGQRPCGQPMPGCGRFLRLAGQPTCGVAPSQRGENAGEDEPDAGANGEAGGGRIATRTGGRAQLEFGSGPLTVLLLHGWTLDHRLWRKQTADLAARFTGVRGVVLPAASRSVLGAGPDPSAIRAAAVALRDELAR